MRTEELGRPLDDTELGELGDFLAASPKAMELARAHGFLTGIASAPTLLMPSVWQQRLLGEPRFESMQAAQRVLGLLMRLYNQIVGELEEGGEVAPPRADEAGVIGAWCAGYLEATRMDEEWREHEQAVMLLFPFAVLAGEIDLVGEEDAGGNVIEDPAPQIQRCRERLGSTVVELNAYWTAWRRQKTAPVKRAAQPGRNDRCPCGSGLKFKKCCALNVN